MSRTKQLTKLDHDHLWHPFTQMRDWCAPDHDPLVIASGRGAWLRDADGRDYIDGNSSIWTNIHGHGHPTIVAAIQRQAAELCHASFLGFTNAPAIGLAAALANLVPGSGLGRVFYTDDGSTAMECAVKMAIQYWQLSNKPERCEFLAFDQAYHGDTLGAAALGGIPAFHGRFAGLGFNVHHASGIADLDAMPREVSV